MDNNLTVVFSTRKKNDEFIKHLITTSGLNTKLEVLCYENNGEFSLPQIYNKALLEAKNDHIIFCHDDLDFKLANRWGFRMLKKFSDNPDYGIIGAAGSTRLIDGCWWFPDMSTAKGTVLHVQKDGKVTTSRYSIDTGTKLNNVVCVDGLFIAVDRAKLKSNFDEDFKGFHFYDIPFCVNNFTSGVKIGVFTDIRLIHKSIGEVNQSWHDGRKQFNDKYNKLLPLII